MIPLFIFHLIHTIHPSIVIHRGSSPSPHRWSAQWENHPAVPSRESNSGLPYRLQGWAKLVLIALESYSVALKRLTFNLR
jgi:hypothetical protein